MLNLKASLLMTGKTESLKITGLICISSCNQLGKKSGVSCRINLNDKYNIEKCKKIIRWLHS